MEIAHLALLQTQRDLYAMPRSMERFKAYLATMADGEDLVLPLAAMNPMGKEHVAATLDQALALDAEGCAVAAGRAAAARLGALDYRLETALVVADDAQGGWTNRYFTELQGMVGSAYELRKPWVVTLIWTGSELAIVELGRQVQAAIYRYVHKRVHGLAQTLGELVVQEARVAQFAGLALPERSAAELGALRAAFAEVEATPIAHYPLVVPWWFGDAVAVELGYPALGRMAGDALALGGLAAGDPVAALSEA